MYIGTALNVAATGLSIHKACTVSGEEKCRRAQYVESSASNGPRRRQPPGGGVCGVCDISFRAELKHLILNGLPGD